MSYIIVWGKPRSRITVKDYLPIIVCLSPSHFFVKAKVEEEVGDKAVRWEDVVYPGQAAILSNPISPNTPPY